MSFTIGAGWYFTFVIKIDSQYTGVLFVINFLISILKRDIKEIIEKRA